MAKICDFIRGMDSRLGAVPDDIEALKAALVAEVARTAHAKRNSRWRKPRPPMITP